MTRFAALAAALALSLGAASLHAQTPKSAQKAAEQRAVTCTANPVCVAPSRRGGCQGVEWNYTGADAMKAGKQDIIRLCQRVNYPDPCKCAVQCARVARCFR